MRLSMKQLWVATAVLFALMIPVDLAIGRWFPGFYAALGLLGTLVMVLVPKWVGKRGLQRGADYYEEGSWD